MNKIKKHDIFRWSYSSQAIDNFHFRTDIYWAVSRICLAKETKEGILFLEDTFWNDDSNRRFTLQDVQEKFIELEYLGNLEEMEHISEYLIPYYDSKDIIDLRHANNKSASNLYIKKGAQKSLAAMKSYLESELEKKTNKIAFETNQINRIQETLTQLTEETKNLINLP